MGGVRKSVKTMLACVSTKHITDVQPIQIEWRNRTFRSIVGRNPPLKPFFNFQNVPVVCLLLIA